MTKTIHEMTSPEVKALIQKSKARIKAEEHSAVAPGMLINRNRPRGSGWCGTESCAHPSHARFSEVAA